MTIEKALEIAVAAHKGQLDKGGRPYILHVLQVMMAGKTDEEKIVGVLHDVVEDTDWTFEKLEKEGFGKTIIEALECVTKLDPEEDYEAFTERVKKNPLAIRVKLNDLRSNMDLTRLDKVTERDIERYNRYLKAYRELIALV
ncbi:MAG TPA: HD domain-containing protein [Cytophagaceae bacterium]|jgi:(p)ppGpp synthase/HD superfamily hydrolase|nr:HD domain-containing protein [Cytophagaceae bacterium]